LEENTMMRKFQEFLRAHCYDIAAYFISTTGLLFPRQAIAGDAPMPSTGTPAVYSLPACTFQQLPPDNCEKFHISEPLLDSAPRRASQAAASPFSMELKTDHERAAAKAHLPGSCSMNTLQSRAPDSKDHQRFDENFSEA